MNVIVVSVFVFGCLGCCLGFIVGIALGGAFEAGRQGKREIGNTAKMREALVQCELFLGNVTRHGHPTLNPGDKCTACEGADELRGMVCRALSAPPRNCDVMDWRTAWAKWRTENHPQKPVGYSECYESTTMFMDWYTGMSEQKGGAE